MFHSTLKCSCIIEVLTTVYLKNLKHVQQDLSKFSHIVTFATSASHCMALTFRGLEETFDLLLHGGQ